MPRPVCITYDSTCDLTPQLLERFHIQLAPIPLPELKQEGQRAQSRVFEELKEEEVWEVLHERHQMDSGTKENH